MLQSFFDPGHGFLSSPEEVAVAVAAVAVFALVGGAAEYLGDAKGGAVIGALAGFLVVLLGWGSPVLADEWHYAVVVAVPVALVVLRYRGREE